MKHQKSAAEVIERIKTVKFFICGKVTCSAWWGVVGMPCLHPVSEKQALIQKFCAIANY